MKILVINVGSTSIKYQLYEMDTEELARRRRRRAGRLAAGAAQVAGGLHRARRPRSPRPPCARGSRRSSPQLTGPGGALKDLTELRAVGHRVVHGGETLVQPTRHHRRGEGDHLRVRPVRAAPQPGEPRRHRGGAGGAPRRHPRRGLRHRVPRRAAAARATSTRVPYELYLERGLRRYGFHGPSHQFMAASASEFLKTDLSRLKLITCHLGGGASVVRHRRRPLGRDLHGHDAARGAGDGHPLGRRRPGAGHRARAPGHDADADRRRCSTASPGLLGLSGVSGRLPRRGAGRGRRATTARTLAIEVFVHRSRKYVGAYAAVLGGADAIVFTGGIGENSARVRAAVCEGLRLHGRRRSTRSRTRARDARGAGGVVDIAAPRAPTRVLVVATDEERMIAREVARVTAGPTAARRASPAAPSRWASACATCTSRASTATRSSARATSSPKRAGLPARAVRLPRDRGPGRAQGRDRARGASSTRCARRPRSSWRAPTPSRSG